MGGEEEKETTWQKAEAAFTGYDCFHCLQHVSMVSQRYQPGHADRYQQAVQRVL